MAVISFIASLQLSADDLRASHGITVPFWPPMHPGWLRCSSRTDPGMHALRALPGGRLDTQYDTPTGP